MTAFQNAMLNAGLVTKEKIAEEEAKRNAEEKAERILLAAEHVAKHEAEKKLDKKRKAEELETQRIREQAAQVYSSGDVGQFNSSDKRYISANRKDRN